MADLMQVPKMSKELCNRESNLGQTAEIGTLAWKKTAYGAEGGVWPKLESTGRWAVKLT